MRRSRELVAILSLGVVAALAAGGCGGSSKSSSTGADTNALSAEAKSAATGDIPDNQVFLVFHDRAAGYSIKFPEGWTRSGSGGDVGFKDKNNLVHVVVAPGPAPMPATASAQLGRLKQANRSLVVTTAPHEVTIAGRKVVKSGYSTRSAPNPVTGKRVTLVVDRYQLAGGTAAKSKTATVDLGTPKGVDNVDAYRLMIDSFKWL